MKWVKYEGEARFHSPMSQWRTELLLREPRLRLSAVRGASASPPRNSDASPGAGLRVRGRSQAGVADALFLQPGASAGRREMEEDDADLPT